MHYLVLFSQLTSGFFMDHSDDESDELWDYVTRNVEKLEKDDPVQAADSKKKKQEIRPVETVKTPLSSSVEKEKQKLSSSLGLDRRTDEKLRRGQMSVEAILDLHGLSQREASPALTSFINTAYEQGKRCVLVVTGKGKNSRKQEDGEFVSSPGVLRQRVPEWLRDDPLGYLVLRFYPAKPQHGGDGAFYVLLKRKR